MGAKKITAQDIQFMSFRQIADKTTYHVKSIERFAREGRLKSIRINGKRVVTLKALNDFLESSVEDGKLEF